MVVPVLWLAAVAPAHQAEHPHLAGLLAGLHAVAYALGEELGWRGYLQDALRPLQVVPRYVVLGLMWASGTRPGTGSVPSMLGRLAPSMDPGWVAAGIGNGGDRTRRLMVATVCPFFTYTEVSSGRDRQLLLAGLIPFVVMLVHLGWGWRLRRQRHLPAEALREGSSPPYEERPGE